jgi:hypothetical protein
MSVTFDAGSGHTATISRNPSHPLDWYPMRYNQSSTPTADGAKATYDGGPTVIKGTLIFNGVDFAEGVALRTWLITYAVYEKNSFTITPPGSTDIGAGAGTALTTAYFNGGNSLEGVFVMTGGGLWNITFPYRK